MESKPKFTQVNKYTRQIVIVFLALVFLIPAAWAGLYGLCLAEWWACDSQSYIGVTILTIIATMAPVGLAYRRQAIRAERGRVTMKPVTGFNSFGLSIPALFGKPDAIPMQDESDRG